MKTVNVFYGSDNDFDKALMKLKGFNILSDLFNHINKKEISISGVEKNEEKPLYIENLILHTDDYGGINEWALLGFSNNILEHSKVQVDNLYLNNPPIKIYEDVKKTYSELKVEHRTAYKNISTDQLAAIVNDYRSIVIGQDNVIKQLVSSIYSLKNPNRKRPVTFLFLGESGVGKTETAKYLSSFLEGNMVRIQFSMQQTSEAYQYIFGAEHGENSLARELVR